MNNITGVRPVVSFCIPVYNNAEAAAKIVKGILASDDTRFQVIAADNASTDNTQEVLTQIHDTRFRYIRNAKNLGTHMNWLKALELGRGEWLYFVIGRDRINSEYIPQLIEILEDAGKNGITFMYDGYIKNNEPVIFSGIEAMTYFLGTLHPTGSIFSRKLFEAIPDREYYFTHSDVYPENYLRRDMLLNGKGAAIRSGVYSYPSSIIDRKKIKSTVEHDRNLYDMFYAPRRRTMLFFEILDMIALDMQDKFTGDEIDRYFSAKFLSLMRFVSTEWRNFCNSYEWQAHYGQKVRRIGLSEMLRNILKAYSDTKAHLLEKGIYSRSKQRIMYKNMCRITAKSIAKVFLETIGMMQILRDIKSRIKH